MRINTTEDSQVGCVQSITILLWLVFIIMFLGVAFPRAKMKARISLVLLTLTGLILVIFLRVNVCPTEKLFRRSSPLPVDRKASPELQLLPDPRAQPNENDRIYRILKVVEKVGIDKLDEMVETLENPEKSPKNISALLKLGHFSEKEFAKKH